MSVLNAGYWPSYNVPFYPVIYNMSGYPEMVDNFGTFLSYELAPRAKIFRRDQGKVVDMESMQAIMRYNGMYLGHVSCLYVSVTASHFINFLFFCWLTLNRPRMFSVEFVASAFKSSRR